MKAPILLLACFATLLSSGPAHYRARVGDVKVPSKRLLYITLSAGFHHQVVPLSAKVLKDIGQLNAFDVTATDDVSVITSGGLKPYNAVAFYATGELPISDDQKQALIDFVKSGGGFLGFHSATDTFYKWPDYGEMIGGYFDGHPWHQEVTVKVEDTRHPATRHLGTSGHLRAGARLRAGRRAGQQSP